MLKNEIYNFYYFNFYVIKFLFKTTHLSVNAYLIVLSFFNQQAI